MSPSRAENLSSSYGSARDLLPSARMHLINWFSGSEIGRSKKKKRFEPKKTIIHQKKSTPQFQLKNSNVPAGLGTFKARLDSAWEIQAHHYLVPTQFFSRGWISRPKPFLILLRSLSKCKVVMGTDFSAKISIWTDPGTFLALQKGPFSSNNSDSCESWFQFFTCLIVWCAYACCLFVL